MPKADVALGIDLGGTKVDIGIVDDAGKILRREVIKTRKDGADNVVQDILKVVKKLCMPEEQVSAVGIGMAGQIDSDKGTVLFAPNLGWKLFSLGPDLEKRLQVPVKITNDVRAATWGEWLYGSGKGYRDLLCLFIGTGIGAGVVCNGQMLGGSCNTAGEVGHMTIQLNGPLCSCGNYGCFEALAGGWAIARKAQELIAQDLVYKKELLNISGATVETINAKIVFDAYKAGAASAIKIINEVKEALIAGVAGLVNAFNPAKVILGGGIITGMPELLEVIRQGVVRRALKASVEHLEIVRAELKGDAGVIGAAAFARNFLKNLPKKDA